MWEGNLPTYKPMWRHNPDDHYRHTVFTAVRTSNLNLTLRFSVVQIRKENVKTVLTATEKYKRVWVCNNIPCDNPHYARKASLQFVMSSHIYGNNLSAFRRGYISKEDHCSKPQDFISGFSSLDKIQDVYRTRLF